MDMLATLSRYWEYSFVRYALFVGVLIAICSSLFGVTLVLKRFSLIGDGLSHVAFGSVAIATVFQVGNQMPVVLVCTILAAILLLRTGEQSKIQGDTAIAMISVGSLGSGYLLLNLYSNSANLTGDVCSTLFGSTAILTLSKTDVYLSVGLALLVVLVFVLFYHKIFSITFDENFAQATGISVNIYNVCFAVIIAVIIVLAMNLVGSLLISALIVFPAMSAMQLCKSFFAVTISATIFSVICTVLGILISILAGTPVGATIVTADMVGFILCYIVGRFLGGKS